MALQASPVVSVIVPVYNAEDHLAECLTSLVKQTLGEIEIVVVLDAPQDDSAQVARAFADDPRVSIIRLQQNWGLSAAREAGMRVAVGEYLGFVDSDDWVEPEMFQTMVDAARAVDADIVSCGMRRVAADGSVSAVPFPHASKDLATPEQIRAALIRSHSSRMLWFACRNIYRRDALERAGIGFDPELRTAEDSPFNLRAFAAANACAVVASTLYNYRESPTGLTMAKHVPYLADSVQRSYEHRVAAARQIGLPTEFYRDMHAYTARSLLPRLITNALNDPAQQVRRAAVAEVLALPAIRQSVSSTALSEPSLLRGQRLILALAKTRQAGLLARLGSRLS